jgi:hypothetical protein
MDQQAGSPDPNADTRAPAEPLRAVPSNGPAAPSPKKRPGPKTPQGKARSSRSALRFGIYATEPVIPGIERLDEWRGHRDSVIASLAPVGSLETKLAERVALVLWRLRRVIAYEQAEYARANAGQAEFRLPEGNELDKVMRYEAHLSRQLYQAKHELEILQKQRRGEATPIARLDIGGQIGE